MADYRLYCSDDAGHIGLADWFAADNDDAALATARDIQPAAQSCEVWHKSRIVARLLADGQVERFAASGKRLTCESASETDR